ncbi:MAG: murein hydrolase activator EnvC family protein [Deltaproteobacteria bacterium]
MKTLKKKVNKKLLLLILLIILMLSCDVAFYYSMAFLNTDITKNISKIKEEYSSAEKQVGKIRSLEAQMELIKSSEKDEAPDKTLLINLILLTKFIGKDKIISIQPDIKRIDDEDNLVKIPIKIEFITDYTKLIKIFSDFSKEYPEPKFENMKIEYVENAMKVSVDFISVSRKLGELDTAKISRVFDGINKVKSPIGFFYDYAKETKQLAGNGLLPKQDAGAVIPDGAKVLDAKTQVKDVSVFSGNTLSPQKPAQTKKKVKVKIEYNDIEQTKKDSVEKKSQTKPQDKEQNKSGTNTVKKPVVTQVTFALPVKGVWNILYKFGQKIVEKGMETDFHNGADIAGKEGTAVFAADNGKIIFAGEMDKQSKSIILEGTSGKKYKFVYSNLGTVVYTQGKTVKKGQKIGTIGKDSLTGKEYVHFGIMLAGKFENPMNLKYAGVK